MRTAVGCSEGSGHVTLPSAVPTDMVAPCGSTAIARKGEEEMMGDW